MKPAGSAAVAVAMPGPGGWTTGRGASPGSGADGLLVLGTGWGVGAAETGEPNAAPRLCSCPSWVSRTNPRPAYAQPQLGKCAGFRVRLGRTLIRRLLSALALERGELGPQVVFCRCR
jgi:hypothetical protein